MTANTNCDTTPNCDYDGQALSEPHRICWHLRFYRKIPRFRFHFYDFVSLITEGTIFRHSAIPCETCLALFCVKRRFCSGRLQNHLKKRVIMYLSYESTFFIVNLTPKLNLITLLLFKATKFITNRITDQKKVLCRFLPYGRITSTSDITFRQKSSVLQPCCPANSSPNEQMSTPNVSTQRRWYRRTHKSSRARISGYIFVSRYLNDVLFAQLRSPHFIQWYKVFRRSLKLP